jgi:hypothetical protein
MAMVETACEESPRAPSLFARYPLSTGVGVGVATLVPHAFFTPEASRALAAIVIALIAGIYFGFGGLNPLDSPPVVETFWRR